MEANEGRINKRKKAYGLIKRTIGVKADSPEDEVTRLADRISGELGIKNDLKQLREGISDPSERLIKAFRFKSFIGGLLPESEIDAYLVDPFAGK
jgi:hypothetical protein